MRKSSALLLGGITVAIGIYGLLRSPKRNKPNRDIHLSTADLDFPQVSHEEIVSERLIDLNEAQVSELTGLGLDQETIERLLNNRPYRSKLELISRMVLSEAIFATIRDKIAISDGRDPIKVA
jgi:hypothetical protein